MSTAAIVALVVAVIVVAAIVAAVTLMRGAGLGGAGLKHRFGPEYERALAHHDGDEKATRDELAKRVKRYGRMELRPVGAQDAERFEDRWAAVKTQFVDDPGGAVAEADRLIGQLAERRGFPGHETPEHNDALSVHHPHELQGYRQAHAFAGRTDPHGPKDTEELRQALVAAREMFDALIGGARTSTSAPVPGSTPAPLSTAAPASPHVDASAGAATPASVDKDEPADPYASTYSDASGSASGRTTTTPVAAGKDAPVPTGSGRGQDPQGIQDPTAGHDAGRRRSPLGQRFAAISGGGPRKDGTDGNR